MPPATRWRRKCFGGDDARVGDGGNDDVVDNDVAVKEEDDDDDVDGDDADLDDDDDEDDDDYNDDNGDDHDDDERSTLEDLSRAKEMVHIRGFMTDQRLIIINPWFLYR